MRKKRSAKLHDNTGLFKVRKVSRCPLRPIKLKSFAEINIADPQRNRDGEIVKIKVQMMKKYYLNATGNSTTSNDCRPNSSELSDSKETRDYSPK